MIDMTMKAELLPAPLIIKNFVDGEINCNYEIYLLELVNTSEFFRSKSSSGFNKPKSESNGESDALGDNYYLDFKLIASKTALQARSILSRQISKLGNGVIACGSSKCPGGKVQATRLFAALRDCYLSDLIEIRKDNKKKQGIENDICTFLKSLEFKKNLLLFFPYEFTFDTPHTFEEKIKNSIEGLNNDFKTSFMYRNQCSFQYETFFVYLCDDRFVICNVENCKLHYIEYVDTKLIPTYKNIVDSYIN